MRALLLCTATGCMLVTSTSLNSPPHQMTARPVESIDVFSSGAPERPHVDIALIHTAGGWAPSLDAVVQALRERAARMGCDGIVIGDNGRIATCIAYSPAVATYVEQNPDLDDPPSR